MNSQPGNPATAETLDQPAHFGTMLRRLRHQHDVPLAELARRVHYSKSYLSKIENGLRAPTVALAQRCDELFKTDGTLIALVDPPAPRRQAQRGPDTPPPRSARPAQLPRPIHGFTARDSYLENLDNLINLTSHRGEHGTAADGVSSDAHPPAIVLCGPAGIGKTTLAVHWGHRVAPNFPDGQLYVNLRGFHPSAHPLEPTEALARFLDALGVPAQRVPATLDARVGLYRSLLNGRRMLIVLDNASDADQVRPLLPGAPPCCVLITSRHALSGLVVDHGAHSVAIEPLSAAESRDLLLTRLRDQHDTIDAGTLDRILTACGGVPLALALVAARAAAQTAAPTATPTSTVLDTLARDLTDNATVLDALAVGDTTTDLRNVLSWSYRKLDPRAGQLFRLIGLYPGTDIGLPALASLSGSPAAQVSRTAKDLVNAHLLTQAPLGGRYSCHDLLHAYANELLQNHDPAATRQAATDRLLNHYARSAYAAAELLDPNDYDTATACLSGVTVNRPTDHDRALDWFRIEHRTLIEATRLAAATGRDHVTLELANVLRIFLGRQGHWHDQLTVQRLAVDAAHRLADATAEAHAHRRLASGLVELGRYHEARACHQRALEIYAQTPDLLGQVDTQLSLTRLYERQTLHRQALQHAAQALDLCSKIDNPERHAMALGAVGWCHSMLGEHDTALTYCEQAAELVRHTSARQTEANIWDSLGYIHHHLGHHAQATACYHHALAIFRHLDDRFNTAETLDHLADSYLHSGDTEQANDARLEALRILAELDHPHTEQIRHKLTDPTLAPAAASILSPT